MQEFAQSNREKEVLDDELHHSSIEQTPQAKDKDFLEQFEETRT